MSSGYSGGAPDFFTGGGRSGSSNTNLNAQQQFPLRSPLSRIMAETGGGGQIRRPDLIGKRSLAEFQQVQQGGLGFYVRNVKPRPNYYHESPVSPLGLVDLSLSPRIPSASSIPNSAGNPRYGLPVLHPNRVQPLTVPNRGVNNVSSGGIFAPIMAGNALTLNAEDESEKKMMNHRLQELEKELLGDEGGEEDEEEAVSVVTNSEWSETIQNLIDSTRKPTSLSPTSSSSSSCSSTSSSPPIPCTKQHLIDAAAAISEGKSDSAAEILGRLQHISNPRGTSEQRLTAYVVSALKSRLNSAEHPPSVAALYGKEQTLSIQMLYDNSPCFKLGFMAANLAILDATSDQGFRNIHVVDFDVGQGSQYEHLLHALAGKNPGDALNITTFADVASGEESRLSMVGDRLKTVAKKIGVGFQFSVMSLNISELSRENLGIDPNEALAVNFAFKLYTLPDESVTTENLRDELLRRVKSLSPTVLTLVEQEMNANTAPLTVRVREVIEHYGALFDSLEATVPRENTNRARIEAAIGRRIGNSISCDGRERVERCEVLGKWRARMSMAGFQPIPMSQLVTESLRVKLNPGTRVNPGFTVSQQSGSLCFGWINRILTVASAWR